MNPIVTKEQAGTYRQLAFRLRWGMGRRERVSERPRHEKTHRYLDSDDAPTLVTFVEGDPIDVPALLQSGAIQQRQSAAASTTDTLPVVSPTQGGRRG